MKELENWVNEDWIEVSDRAQESGEHFFSFQSKLLPNRHCWIDFGLIDNKIAVDLEDWELSDKWDNAVYNVTVKDTTNLKLLLKAWFTNSPNLITTFENLNTNYKEAVVTQKN